MPWLQQLGLLTSPTPPGPHAHWAHVPPHARIVPALLYDLPETTGLIDRQLTPCAGAHNSYLRRITGMVRRLDSTLSSAAQMHTAADVRHDLRWTILHVYSKWGAPVLAASQCSTASPPWPRVQDATCVGGSAVVLCWRAGWSQRDSRTAAVLMAAKGTGSPSLMVTPCLAGPGRSAAPDLGPSLELWLWPHKVGPALLVLLAGGLSSPYLPS
eukprot:81641-Chlamydomonas_euryale.AAC.33